MYDHYTLQVSFEEVRENETFIFKPLFSDPILYRKIKERRIGGILYNAEQVKIGKKNYEYFDSRSQVRIIK